MGDDIGPCTICGKPMMPWASPLKKFRGRLAHRKCQENWYRRMAWHREEVEKRG